MQVEHNGTQSIFASILDIIRGRLLNIEERQVLPRTYPETLKRFKPFYHAYKEVHVCIKGCIMYKGEHSERDKCPKCKTSRYRLGKEHDGVRTNGRARCIFRYWPLKSLLEYIFLCPEYAAMVRSFDATKLPDQQPGKVTGIHGANHTKCSALLSIPLSLSCSNRSNVPSRYRTPPGPIRT